MYIALVWYICVSLQSNLVGSLVMGIWSTGGLHVIRAQGCLCTSSVHGDLSR